MSAIFFKVLNAETINIDLNKLEYLTVKMHKKCSMYEKKTILDKVIVQGELVHPKYRYFKFSRSGM